MKLLICLICLTSLSLFGAETVTISDTRNTYSGVKIESLEEKNGCLTFLDFFNVKVKVCGSYTIRYR